MSVPDRVLSAIALVDDLGRSTIHGPLPQPTVHALWEAAATLASALRAPQGKCIDCRHYWERRGLCTRAEDPDDPRKDGPGRPWREPETCAPPWCPGFELNPDLRRGEPRPTACFGGGRPVPTALIVDKAKISETASGGEPAPDATAQAGEVAKDSARASSSEAAAVSLSWLWGFAEDVWWLVEMRNGEPRRAMNPTHGEKTAYRDTFTHWSAEAVPKAPRQPLVESGELPPRWTACTGGRAMLVGHFTADQAWQIHGLCLDTDDPDAMPRDAPVQPMSPQDEVRAWRQWAFRNCKTIEEYQAERALAARDEAGEQRWEIWEDDSGLTFVAADARNKHSAYHPDAKLFASFVCSSSMAIKIWDALRTEHLATPSPHA